MSSDFDFCFEEVIGHEGGYTNRSSDPGNWTGGKVGIGVLKGTKYGIASHSYPSLDIKNLTLDEAKEIYRRDYYETSGATLCLPGADLCVFDAAVNTGVGRAIRWLQTAAGTTSDGRIGPMTRAAVRKVMASDPKGFVKEFQAQRTWHHMKLDSMDDEYGLGWSRRIIDVTMTAMERMS